MIEGMIARSRAAAGRAKQLSTAAADRLLSRLAPATHVAMQTKRDYREYEDNLRGEILPKSWSGEVMGIVSALRRTGCYTVENYWDRKTCEQAVAEIDRMFRDYPQFIHPAPKSDVRLYGADLLSPLIAKFGLAPALAEVATSHNRIRTRLGMTLAARLAPSEGNLGSGEGWHRDQFFCATKAMLYLTDVGPDNGPFQMLERSFACEDVCRDVRRAPLAHRQYRIGDDQVARLLEEDALRLKTFCAPAGTLIVFNASAIHRGKPIGSSVRYALTNYYFTRHWSDEEIAKHFAPVATPHDALSVKSA
jgi:hypothetical protein